jgi:1-acyl-sn-glycerol-3-phosphate acyltransferase
VDRTDNVIALHDGSERRRARRPRRADGAAGVYSLNTMIEPEGDLTVPDELPPVTGWEGRATEALAFLKRRLTGQYDLDDYGFDADLTDGVVLPLLRRLYSTWFRVDVNGVENIPATGGALLVANHSGGILPLDVAMTAVAVHDQHPAGRHLRMLGHDRVFSTPGLSVLARRMGVTLACEADAARLLSDGELVGAWPEGFLGIGKPFQDRYQLQTFGRGGFVAAAVAAGVPIIPVSIVGAEEIHPVLGTVQSLARVLDVPYFPITPTFPWLGPLGLVPLPSKWYLEFGTPIDTAHLQDTEDQSTIFELTDQVRETIQSTLYRLLVQRRGTWR